VNGEPLSVWDYSGVVAEAYDRFFGTEPYFDQAFFTQQLAAAGGPALELACGTGRLLLPLLRDGLAVEGLDTSSDMLAILRRKATALKLQPVLHQRPMQDFDLPGRYAAVFCAVNSVQILVTDAEIDAALGCCRRALRPGGVLILTVADRPAAGTEAWRERRRITLDDGALVVIDEQTRRHPSAPCWQWDLRWRIMRATGTEQLLQTFLLRDYQETDLPARLRAAGFGGVHEQRGYTGSQPVPRSADAAGQRIIVAHRP
jgi:SAM-dependent methyltransferase